ncbi:hypothetical protein [Marinomonas sp. 2405UD68-3]|uniref:hypothetical protein n=1 Tax=Marinomonas sp. 2405UD68-3 TaxID=3391835 RepID=UPI0039C921A6
MKNWQILVIGFVSWMLLGCAKGIESPQNVSDQGQAELTRTQLQLQLSQLSDAVWLRTGELIFMESNLPLTSADPATVEKIKVDLRRQIFHAQEKISAVNHRVQRRLQHGNALDYLTINLVDIELNGKKLDINERTRFISLVKGEEKVWRVAFENVHDPITMTLILSETGELFIEEQGVLTVTPWMSFDPFVTSISWFNQAIRSQGQLNLTLQPSLQ